MFDLDTVAPTVTMTAPANNSTTNNLPTLSASAADNPGGVGLAGVQFQYSTNGGTTWNNAGPALTDPFSFTVQNPLANGTYEARAMATDNAGNTATSAAVTFTVQPNVLAINRVGSSPTNLPSVQFAVIFSQSITGLTASDFTLAGSGLTGATISQVSGSGTNYIVTVSTGTGNGTLGLNLTSAAGLSASGEQSALHRPDLQRSTSRPRWSRPS